MSKDLFMTNEELVEQIQNGINVQENLGVLYEQNKGYIWKLVKPYTAYANEDDLMQEAYIGLHKAVFKFDFSKGFLFLTYAGSWIRQTCIRYIDNFSRTKRIPVYMIERISEYHKLVSEHGQCVKEDIVMKEMGITEEQYNLMMNTIRQSDLISMDEVINSADSNTTIGELLPYDKNIEQEMIEKQCSERLWDIVGSILDDKQKDIVIRYYINQESLTDMAVAMGCSRQNISRLKRKAESILKNITEIQELAEFWGYDSMMAYSGKNSVENIAIRHIEFEEKENKMMDNLKNTFRKLYEERKIENGNTGTERQIQVSTD